MHLVIVDTAQIQSYIFGSNRLRENIGASYLVAQSTGDWAKEAVRQIAGQNNIQPVGTIDNTKHIENPAHNLDAEVLYAGGGNFVVLFRDERLAKDFTRVLSRKVLTEAPNLQLVIVQNSFDWNGESLFHKIKATFKKLAEEKRARALSSPLLGLGVTVMCRSTGLPATQVVQPIPTDPTSAYPASAEIAAKLDAVLAANQRLDTMFASTLGRAYAFPRDLDEMGRTAGEHSFIAVVHADGNGMGQRIMEIGTGFPNPSQNRDYINALRTFSDQVDAAGQQALQEVLNKLAARIQNDGGNRIVRKNATGKIIAEIKLKSADGGQWFLPFRPIVFGGDDVTFVCDGRLGLSLAIEYMRQLERHTQNLPDGKGKLTACAGVAIVKAHYPFARAYALADELCKSAKNYRREIRNLHSDWDGSCMDWHFALSGLSGSIKEIRQREYAVKAGSLILRPVALDDNPQHSGRSWTVVEKGIAEFQGEGWTGRRNKMKALRDALREGPDAVQHFLTKYNEGKPLPDVEPSLTDWKNSGWQGGYCGYFDALELADWFIPL